MPALDFDQWLDQYDRNLVGTPDPVATTRLDA
jgi:hypothetical protein